MVITDTLPANVGFNSVINSAGFISNTGTAGMLAFLTPTLAAGTVHTLTFDVQVDANTLADILNTVAITSSTPISGNGPFTGVVTTALAPPILVITKTAQSAQVETGSNLNYLIEIHNQGGSNATGAVVQDALPANLNFLGPVTIAGTTVGTPGTAATLPVIATGLTISRNGIITLTVPVSVASGLANNTIINNSASVTATQLSTPLSDDVDVTILAPVIQVDKIASVAAADIGNTIFYTYTVRNSGGVVLSTIAITDTPLGPISLISTTLAPGQSTGGTLSYGPVTLNDFNNNNPITNTVLARGSSPLGTVVTDGDDVSVSVNGNHSRPYVE